ncbi:hypothetical protein CFI00_03415 [Nocardioides sp. S5]|nr:hypothetical protein CFI00_03415 [Nocardioides sp. S5]
MIGCGAHPAPGIASGVLVCDSHRVLFVHVPKTGGVSVEGVMRRACPDARKQVEPRRGRHAPLGRILDSEPALTTYWSYGFVRNPWARMVSWYAMIEDWRRRITEGGPGSVKNQGNDMWRAVGEYADFEEFVLRGTEEWPRMGRPQVAYLDAPAHGREVDFIGRTESLAADLQVVQERLGVEPTAPPRRNSSPHGHYRDYFTDAARRRVAEVFEADIDRFGYTF